jgi:hypothetical protein
MQITHTVNKPRCSRVKAYRQNTSISFKHRLQLWFLGMHPSQRLDDENLNRFFSEWFDRESAIVLAVYFLSLIVVIVDKKINLSLFLLRQLNQVGI